MLETFSIFKRYAANNAAFHVLNDEEIKEIQIVLLEIMDDFDALCRKHDLTYFLTGGSALGAVRHQGFIPWDEDIDIIMPRQDYDRLPEIVESECCKKYWVQNLESSKSYDLCFSKFRKKGTKFVEIFENDPEHAGFFLDIYPLENTYDNAVLRLMNGIVDESLFFIASCVRIHQKKDRLLKYANDSGKIKIIVLFKALIGTLFDDCNNRRKWYRRCERWQKKCQNCQSHYVTVSCGRGHYFGEMYRRDKLFPVGEHEFEDRRYFLPKDCPYLLKKLYGKDFMRPTDKNYREMHAVIEWSPDK